VSGNRVGSLTPEQNLAVLEQLATPGPDGKVYAFARPAYERAKEEFHLKKRYSLFLIVTGIVCVSGGAALLWRSAAFSRRSRGTGAAP
jgi:hypothetical protein